jgi:hypothetical protein
MGDSMGRIVICDVAFILFLFTALNAGAQSGSTAGPAAAVDSNVIPDQPLVAKYFNGSFYVDGFPSTCAEGGISYTTRLDCAVAAVKDWIVANDQSATLVLGEGIYRTKVGITLPNDVSGVGLSLEGRSTSTPGYGKGTTSSPGTLISLVAPIGTAVIYQPSAVRNHYPSISIRGIAINAGNNAPSCMDIFGARQSSFEHISCIGVRDGSDHMIAFSDPHDKAFSQGSWIYESNFNDIFTQVIGMGEGPSAKVTASNRNGSVGDIVVRTPGNYFGVTPKVFFYGYGQGTQPCTKMPEAVAIMNGPGLSRIELTNPGNGCVGPIDVQVHAASNTQYGIVIRFVSDSTFNDLRPVGPYATAGMYTNGGSNTFHHMHAYGSRVPYLDHGHAVWEGTECDGPWQYCFDLEGPQTQIIGTSFYTGGNFSGSSGFFFGSNATDTKIIGSQCASPQAAGDYHLFLTSSGPVEGGHAKLPRGTTVVGVSACNSLPEQESDYFGGPVVLSGSSHQGSIWLSPLSEDRTYQLPDASGTLAVSLHGITVPIGGSPLAPGKCQLVQTEVGGASLGQAPRVSPTAYPGDNFDWSAYVSAPNVVAVRICNRGLAEATPKPSTYNIQE